MFLLESKNYSKFLHLVWKSNEIHIHLILSYFVNLARFSDKMSENLMKPSDYQTLTFHCIPWIKIIPKSLLILSLKIYHSKYQFFLMFLLESKNYSKFLHLVWKSNEIHIHLILSYFVNLARFSDKMSENLMKPSDYQTLPFHCIQTLLG